MKITGDYILEAAPNTIWDMLMDREILERTTPGIEELNELGPDSYEAISEVRVGPVKGRFEGNLSIKDKVEGESCTLVVDQKSKMGNVVAEIVMKFLPTDDGKTKVDYTGEAKLSGTLASMGQRIVGGVVSTLSNRFFESLEEELEKRQD